MPTILPVPYPVVAPDHLGPPGAATSVALSVNPRHHLAIVGCPRCGKSALLSRMAHAFALRRRVLVLDRRGASANAYPAGGRCTPLTTMVEQQREPLVSPCWLEADGDGAPGLRFASLSGATRPEESSRRLLRFLRHTSAVLARLRRQSRHLPGEVTLAIEDVHEWAVRGTLAHKLLRQILTHGPAVGLHVIATCDDQQAPQIEVLPLMHQTMVMRCTSRTASFFAALLGGSCTAEELITLPDGAAVLDCGEHAPHVRIQNDAPSHSGDRTTPDQCTGRDAEHAGATPPPASDAAPPQTPVRPAPEHIGPSITDTTRGTSPGRDGGGGQEHPVSDPRAGPSDPGIAQTGDLPAAAYAPGKSPPAGAGGIPRSAEMAASLQHASQKAGAGVGAWPGRAAWLQIPAGITQVPVLLVSWIWLLLWAPLAVGVIMLTLFVGIACLPFLLMGALRRGSGTAALLLLGVQGTSVGVACRCWGDTHLLPTVESAMRVHAVFGALALGALMAAQFEILRAKRFGAV